MPRPRSCRITAVPIPATSCWRSTPCRSASRSPSYNDPRDPDVFSDKTAADPRVRDLARRVRVSADGGRKGWSAHIAVSLRDGRRFEDAQETFLGCPQTPMSDEQLRFKFERLCRDARLKPGSFDALMQLETLPSLADAL